MINKKIIGILGGIGSASTSHFFDMVIKHQQKNGCIEDGDFCEIILYNLPPLIELNDIELFNRDTIKHQIIKAIKKIEHFNCDVIVIPCNTIHYYYDEIKRSTDIPILNIIEETLKSIDKDRIGIMCTSTTNKLKLYTDDFIYPDKDMQKDIDRLILSIQLGSECASDFSNLAMDFVKQNFLNGIVLGCTELSIPMKEIFLPITVYDSSKILSEALFK